MRPGRNLGDDNDRRASELSGGHPAVEWHGVVGRGVTSALCMRSRRAGQAESHRTAPIWRQVVRRRTAISLLVLMMAALSACSATTPAPSSSSAPTASGQPVSAQPLAPGTWSTGPSLPQAVDAADVQCSSATACVAADNKDQSSFYLYNGTSWSADKHTGEFVEGLSCPSATFCMAAGQQSFVFNGKSWSSAAPEPASPERGGFSCASAQFCMMVDGSGNFYTYTA